MDPDFLLSAERVEERHWWFAARRELVTARLVHHMPADAATLLDVGSGTGGNLAHFSRAMPELACVGLERDNGAREACVQRGLDVTAGDAEQLPYPDSSFDVVTMLDVLEHLADDALGMREVARVLAPGGVAVLTVPALPSLWGPHDVIAHHRRRYLREQLPPIAEAPRLEVLECSYFNSRLLPAAWLQRKVQAATGRHAPEEKLPPRLLNSAFLKVFRGEAERLARGGYRIGLSLMMVARKPETAVARRSLPVV